MRKHYAVQRTLYSSIQERRLCAVTGSHERLMQKCEIQAKFCENFVDQLFLQNMDHVEALNKKNCADNHLKKPVWIVLCNQQTWGLNLGRFRLPKVQLSGLPQPTENSAKLSSVVQLTKYLQIDFKLLQPGRRIER